MISLFSSASNRSMARFRPAFNTSECERRGFWFRGSICPTSMSSKFEMDFFSFLLGGCPIIGSSWTVSLVFLLVGVRQIKCVFSFCTDTDHIYSKYISRWPAILSDAVTLLEASWLWVSSPFPRETFDLCLVGSGNGGSVVGAHVHDQLIRESIPSRFSPEF